MHSKLSGSLGDFCHHLLTLLYEEDILENVSLYVHLMKVSGV